MAPKTTGTNARSGSYCAGGSSAEETGASSGCNRSPNPADRQQPTDWTPTQPSNGDWETAASQQIGAGAFEMDDQHVPPYGDVIWAVRAVLVALLAFWVGIGLLMFRCAA
jgi:hypothetical protein